jgi:hypothetical protein
MTDISKRFEQLIAQSARRLNENNEILPIKTSKGILVGDVLITSHGNLKNLYKKDELIFKEISLNEVAIRLANLLARNKDPHYCDRLYKEDQDYGRWFVEWQLLKQQYHNAVKSKDLVKSDVLLARYEDVKLKAELAKNNALRLINP